MKINELTMPDLSLAKIKLTDAGYTKIGYGDYSTIWSKENKPYVLKLFWSKDFAYLEFIKLVKANPNIHFPKFGKMYKIDNQYSVVKMEKLTPLDYNNVNSKYANTYDRIEYYFHKLKYEGESDLLDDFPELKKACDLIYTNIVGFGEGKYTLDIHPGNVMLRGDTLVITDPVHRDI